MTLTTRVARWLRGRILLREVQGIRQELARLRETLQTIADALQTANAQRWPSPPPPAPHPDLSPTEVTFVRDEAQAEYMEIELTLAAARGLPPTEDEILAEYLRRHEPRDRVDG